MTVEVNEIILKLEKEGYSHGKISEIMWKNRRTILYFFKKVSTSDSRENSGRSGRVQKTSKNMAILNEKLWLL